MADAAQDDNLARIQDAIDAITRVEGLFMEPAALTADLLDMANVYGDGFTSGEQGVLSK